jgi:nitrate reductase delta subunit
MTSLDRLSTLFAYPGDGYAERAAASARALGLTPLRAFAEAVADLPATELQERFVEAFDLDPDCSPDLGWHLFGERYERGEWLASLRGDLRRLAVEDSAELPDHLANVLRILARDDAPQARALAELVAPALARLEAALARRDSPFRHAVAAVRHVTTQMQAGPPGPAGGPPERHGDV